MYIGRGASFISRLMDNMYICAPPLSRCIHYRNMYVHMQGTISTPSAPSLGHMPAYVPPSPVTSLPHVYIHKTRGPSPHHPLYPCTHPITHLHTYTDPTARTNARTVCRSSTHLRPKHSSMPRTPDDICRGCGEVSVAAEYAYSRLRGRGGVTDGEGGRGDVTRTGVRG